MDPWEQHKDLLRTLYFSKDREVGSLRSIIDRMKIKHGFVRSKGQYERQFKKWGFRKNSTAAAWKIIHGKIEKRQKEGKSSVIYKSGKHVQEEKVNKEKRHNFRTVEELFRFEELPETPAGFAVCTPMSDVAPPPVLINNFPSLQLFGRLKSFVRAQMSIVQQSAPPLQSQPQQINNPSGLGLAAFVDFSPSPPYSTFDHRTMELVDINSMTTMTFDDGEVHNSCDGQDLTLFDTWKLKDDDLNNLFQVSRAGDLSSLVLPMLHLASNNSLPENKARDVVELILSSDSRRLFNTLISTQSPATQAIARSLLPQAIKAQDVELVRSLLDTGINPDSPINYLRERPLQFAVWKGDMDMTRLLLSYGAQVNLLWAHGTWAPLRTAAKYGRLDLVELLLEAGTNADARASPHDGTALQIAARVNNFEMVQLLLNAGADVNAYGETALQAAAETGNTALVQVLLSHGADANAPATKSESTALERAASAGHLEIVNLLLAHGAVDVVSAMQVASTHAHSQVVQTLLRFEARADVSLEEVHKRMALKAGVWRGDYQLVQDLLESGMDPDAPAVEGGADWTTALQVAVLNGSFDLVRLLMTYGANVNAPGAGIQGRTALQYAAWKGNTELVKLLLEAGADVNAPPSNVDPMMPLEGAVLAQSLETVQLLLDYGADTFEYGAAAIMVVNIFEKTPEIEHLLLGRLKCSGVAGPVDDFDYSEGQKIEPDLLLHLVEYGVLENHDAMLYAIYKHDLELVERILQSGADVNAGQCQREKKDGNEDPWVLEAAVRFHDLDMLQLLLQYEANTQEKARALQVAAYNGETEFVEELIRAGADIDAAPLGCRHGNYHRTWRTALQGAAEQGHVELVRLLLENGAEVERQTISEDEEGTAFQFAAISGSISTANELIQRGANVNAASLGTNGRTALEGAAEHGRLDMVQLLLNLEAEVRGSRALQFARDEGHDGVVTLLLANGFEDDVNMTD